MILCIDSNVFIWGIKKKATKGQDEMIARAEYLFEWADTSKHQILIPSIVLAECLAPEPLEKYPVIMEKVYKGFMIADFDTRAAAKYGQIFMHRIEEMKKIAKEAKIAIPKMKMDHLIIASALVHNAAIIYSNDPGIRKFGQKHIDVKDLPKLPPKANTLF